LRPDGEFAKSFFAALTTAGLGAVPEEFAVSAAHQIVSRDIVDEIGDFIRRFDRITAGEQWRAAVRREAPMVAWRTSPEVCFFSAWDFHLPPEGGWWLIEFNDNGSGLLLAAAINRLYFELGGAIDGAIEPPPTVADVERRIVEMVEQEAKAFFGKEAPDNSILILDDAQSLRDGRFRRELLLLSDFLGRLGRRVGLGAPAELRWDGRNLLFDGQTFNFVVNRSTDFLWESDELSALRDAHENGTVYVAPNPFTYSTRSDKRLLEWLSLPQRDDELGISLDDRRMLREHVPETHVLRRENVDRLAREKSDFVFKPLHGFAGRGLLASGEVGRARLRRLVSHGPGYVAQKRVAKSTLEVGDATLWTDLRVWAYREEITLVSGRASRRQDRLDLAHPGGFLPTFCS
jgi:hypothetical protein